MNFDNLRIGLDIDDVLCYWEEAYCQKYNIRELIDHPQHIITHLVNDVLIDDKEFWLNLKIKHKPDFIPELYCTKRTIPIEWTRKFLEINEFPIRPIYQIPYNENKSDYIKNKVDLFIDDSPGNVEDLNKNGIKCLMMTSRHNKKIKSKYRINSITKYMIYKRFNEIWNLMI